MLDCNAITWSPSSRLCTSYLPQTLHSVARTIQPMDASELHAFKQKWMWPYHLALACSTLPPNAPARTHSINQRCKRDQKCRGSCSCRVRQTLSSGAEGTSQIVRQNQTAERGHQGYVRCATEHWEKLTPPKKHKFH